MADVVHSFVCPICEEPFVFSVQEGIEANKEVFLRVAHDHELKDAIWKAVIHEKGGRNVEGKDEVMRITYAQGKARREAAQKKAKESARQVKKDRLTR